jgi:hypothetical protein
MDPTSPRPNSAGTLRFAVNDRALAPTPRELIDRIGHATAGSKSSSVD